MKLQGIFPPITTPFQYDGALYKAKVFHNVEKWNKTTLAGSVVCGSTGESVMLTPDEKFQMFEWVAEAAAPEAALSLLQDALANDQSPRVRAEALEELAELPGGVGIPAVIEVAQSHPNRDLRAKAWRHLDDSDDPRARDTVERAPQRP